MRSIRRHLATLLVLTITSVLVAAVGYAKGGGGGTGELPPRALPDPPLQHP